MLAARSVEDLVHLVGRAYGHRGWDAPALGSRLRVQRLRTGHEPWRRAGAAAFAQRTHLATALPSTPPRAPEPAPEQRAGRTSLTSTPGGRLRLDHVDHERARRSRELVLTATMRLVEARGRRRSPGFSL